MWLSFSHDTKQNLTLIGNSQDPLADTLHVLREKLRLHVVDIRGERTFISLIYSPVFVTSTLSTEMLISSEMPFTKSLSHHFCVILYFMCIITSLGINIT